MNLANKLNVRKTMISEKLLTEKYGKDAEIILNTIDGLKSLDCFSKKLMDEAEEIAEIVIGLKLDANSVSAAISFLFALKDKDFMLKMNISNEVLQILKSLIQCEEISKQYTDADGLKDMILAITKDIRVVVIKTAQVLVFARKNVANIEDEDAKIVFKSINDVFAPISARLGLSEIKSELQDLSFEFHEPKQYFKLKEDVKKETRANTHMINEIVSIIKKMLSAHGVECDCYGRIKHLSSIHNKIKYKNYNLKGIYDIAAVRILVKNVSECYLALGLVHSSFNPVDGRFKDYIANPKPNGYQSLHTTVYFKNEFFEVQIRTEEMDYVAERGIAAHWIYKESAGENISKAQELSEQQLSWLRDLIKINEDSADTSDVEYMKQVQKDLFETSIYVLTPKGKIIDMPNGSTPVDFAYRVHTQVGNNCVGALVNKVIVPLSTELQNGDIVEIKTAKNNYGPSEDWLSFVKTNTARSQIKKALLLKEIKDQRYPTFMN